MIATERAGPALLGMDRMQRRHEIAEAFVQSDVPPARSAGRTGARAMNFAAFATPAEQPIDGRLFYVG
jgi:hypothetical protein